MPLQFDSDLAKLKKKLLRMGVIAEKMIREMNAILIDGDTAKLPAIFESEKELDVMQGEIDEETLRLISVYTPVASDLRLLLMVTRINAEIEKIGDKVEAIGHYVENFLDGKGQNKIIDFSHVADLNVMMMHEALDSFVNRSAEQAMKVIESDDEVDRITDSTTRVLMTHMLETPQKISYFLGLMLAAQAMERIADHSVNIAEDVIYIVKGEDVRHTQDDDND